MTASISPFPIRVTDACSHVGLQHVVDQFKRQDVGFCIVKHPQKQKVFHNRKEYQYYKYALWRAEVPSDWIHRNVNWSILLDDGRKNGPKPETDGWKERVVEVWRPKEE